jgi:PAS domain S-box-containing protein
LVGILRPEDVYNHAAALNAPWTWAGIHAFFVLWSCVGSAIAWRFNEIASARTKLILQCAGEGIFGLDRDRKITFINGAAEEMFLLNPGENIGADIRSIIKGIGPEGGAFTGDSSLLAPLSDGIPRGGSNEMFWRSDGISFLVDYHSAPIIEQGELTGLVVTFNDVSARNRAEQSLRTSEKKFRVLAETANDAIVSSDCRGSIIYFNKTAERIFGYSAGEVLGVPLNFLMPEGCHEEKGIEQFMSTAEAEGVGKPVELVGKRKDGSEFPIELSLANWKTGDDMYFTAIIRDITERKQIHNTLAEKAAALTQSNQELEQFAYVASHDLQEPLRMITGYTQLLAKRYQGRLDQDADEYISYAVDGAKRMQTLINDLLAYSRVGTRGKEFTRTECEAILETTLANLQVAIQESGAVVTHDALPALICDGGQIGQLLQNLIGNAIKYRNSRAPEIHIGCKPEDGRWLFWVKDNGIGIDAQYAERIFAIFQRLHTREEYPGTGIGLAVCKKIVDRHGGRIWVDSALGEGSTFHFTLAVSGSAVD